MSSEEKLPEELNKLKITTPLPQFKFKDDNIPLLLNPFYKHETNVTEQRSYKNLQPFRKKQRLRRRSESILDDFKTSAVVNTIVVGGKPIPGCRSMASKVYKQPLKKTMGNGKRNFCLKEPVLRVLQTVSQPQKVRRKMMAQFALNNEGTTLNNCLSQGKTAMVDYRNLVLECQSLSEQNVRISRHYINHSDEFESLKKISLIRAETQCANSSIVDLDDDGKVTNGNSLTSNNVVTPSATISVDYLNVASRSNTSCSQQAGNGAASAVCDDVTIDELASYFETLVHIPKKMSTMAEMMYI